MGGCVSSLHKHLFERGGFISHLPLSSLLAIAFFSLLFTPSTHAASGKVGINFWTTDYGGSVSNSWLATNVNVGVVAQTNWNNVKTPFFMGDNLSASNFVTGAGEATRMSMYVDCGWAGYGEARTSGVPATATEKMLNGRLTAHYGLNVNLSMDEVPFEVYDVYVFVSGLGSDETFTITSEGYSGPPTYCLRAGEPTSYSSFYQATSTNPASPTAGANYVRFQNVQDSSFSIYFAAPGDPQGKKRIYGIQIIEVDATSESAAMIIGR